MFTKDDLDYINSKGLNIDVIKTQIENFKQAFPFAKITSSAQINNGIIKINEDEENKLISLFNSFSKENKITKFVPASGAASRMFKNLYSFLANNKNLENDEFVNTFFNQINKFAFYNELEILLKKNNYKISKENINIIINLLLKETGLNYGSLPKGLLLFHKYDKETKTAFAEHLTEAANYARGKYKKSNIVFTVSKEHKSLFIDLFSKLKNSYENKYDINYNIEFTEQLSETDIIAVNKDNTPYRDKNGNLLFRPGGHGALIQNLNKINSNLIFIKNIDNIVHEKYITETIKYKKIIAGKLILLKNKINNYLKTLDKVDTLKINLINEILEFTENDLFVQTPTEIKKSQNQTKIEYLKNKLNRPIRVCGMVKNEGEPGGGPFWVKHFDNSIQLQIVESSEINKSDKKQVKILNNATHFNPVDIVCSTTNYKGNKFNLNNYINHKAGFISEKSINGDEIKAQELPGLWNGAMADWITIFIEIPISTFNPVKTVNDLLREYHQG